MLSRSKKLALAKAAAAKQEKARTLKGVKAEIDTKDIVALHKDFNNLAIILRNVLTDTTFKDDVQEMLIELNNQTVKLVQQLGMGIMVKNQPVFDEVTIKNLQDIVIPDEIIVKNPTKIPEDLATSKNIQDFQDALTKVLRDVKKSITDNADVIDKALASKQSQNPEDFIPYRRVIWHGNKLVFDDSSMANIRIPVNPPSFQDENFKPTYGLVSSATRRVQNDVFGTPDNRFGGGVTPYAKVLTANDSIAPPAGKSIQVDWVAFVPNSDNTTANQITIGFHQAANPLYIGYAIAHWEIFTGAKDQALDITLNNAQPVSVMVHYKIV